MFIEELKLDFKDVLIKPKRSTISSRKDVDLSREFIFKHSPRGFDGIPIVAANMDSVGTTNMCKALRPLSLVTALHKHLPDEEIEKCLSSAHADSQSRLVFFSMGILDKDVKKFKRIYKNNPYMNICIDVANGYSERFAVFVQEMRTQYPDIIIMAGNVVTSEMTEQLILSGADIVKVGIGPGSVCTTRTQTGVGYPQLSAIIECAEAAHGLGGHVCADGGCTVPGDVAKAFGAGADFVMLGGMLAGHNESGGEIVGGTARLKKIDNIPGVFNSTWTEYDLKIDGEVVVTVVEDIVPTLRELYCLHYTAEDKEISYNSNIVQKYPILFNIDLSAAKMQFYGMSSKTAMEKHSGGVAEYRSSEGKTVLIQYKGKVKETIKDILGGLRSACTYVGARKLKEMSKRTTFVRVAQQINNVFGN